MQEIAVEPVGLQPLERALAGGDGAAPRSIARQHFRDQKNLVALARDGVGDDQLGIAIHFGGVDVCHAELDAAAKRCNRALAVAAIEIPGALPDHGNVRAALAALFVIHDWPRCSESRHCERSEAIHSTAKQDWIASSLAPRND